MFRISLVFLVLSIMVIGYGQNASALYYSVTNSAGVTASYSYGQFGQYGGTLNPGQSTANNNSTAWGSATFTLQGPVKAEQRSCKINMQTLSCSNVFVIIGKTDVTVTVMSPVGGCGTPTDCLIPGSDNCGVPIIPGPIQWQGTDYKCTLAR